MDFAEVIGRLGELDGEKTIYSIVAPAEVAASTTTCVHEEDDDGGAPTGFVYFLEVDLAQEVVDVWSRWRGGRTPSLEDKIEAVIYYASNDAYLPA